MWNHGAGRAFSAQEGSSRVILKVGIRVAQFAVHGCRVARLRSRQGARGAGGEQPPPPFCRVLRLLVSVASGSLAARASRLVIAGSD